MEDIKDVSVGPMVDSKFLKPLRMKFTQNGKNRFWDLIRTHDSVSCILFNTTRNVFILVKQFRPGKPTSVYFNAGMKSTPDNSVQDVDWSKVPPSSGVTIELCAGIVDAAKPRIEVVKSEVLEECGYDVPLENFTEVIRSKDIGYTGATRTMFYAECTDSMKISAGGGLAAEGELIDVIEMTVAEARDYVQTAFVNSGTGLLFGILWFFANKYPKRSS